MQVELQRLGKTYDGDQWAVRDLALTIPKGSVFGLIGPNGAGKSTTLRMLAAVAEPSEGEIRYDGAQSADLEVLRRRIGFLGDGNPLYKQLTAREYLAFFGECFGLRGPPLQNAVDRTLEAFRLTDKADSLCKTLSKGMRQRLLVARCVIHGPELLILDEPADGLDPSGRADLKKLLLQLRDEGTTVVISSHILSELDELCDRVAILQKGRLVVQGPVSAIADSYEAEASLYELRVLGDAEPARPILAAHGVLIESEHVDEGATVLDLRVRGGDAEMAELLPALVEGKVRICAAGRKRRRLEDVYNRVSEDQVN